MENISFREAVGALEIERGEDLAREDRIRNVGRVLGDLFHDAIAEELAFLVPGAFAQTIRNVLNECSHHVFAGRRESGIDVGCDHAIDPQLFGNFAKLCDVITALGELKRWHQGEKGALRRGPIPRHACNARLFAQDEINFRAWPVHLDAGDCVAEILG